MAEVTIGVVELTLTLKVQNVGCFLREQALFLWDPPQYLQNNILQSRSRLEA